jgi:hypothetical protein
VEFGLTNFQASTIMIIEHLFYFVKIYLEHIFLLYSKMADFPEFIPEFFDENEVEIASYSEEYLYYEEIDTGFTPDPILVFGVTLVIGLVLIGFLFQFWETVFGSALTRSLSVENQSKVTTSDRNKSDFTSETVIEKDLSTQCGVSAQFPQKITRWCELITHYANKHNLDPDLVAALVWLESGGNELAYSRSGAVGLMQIMPSDGLAASFMCVNGPCFRDRPSMEELQDPEFNIAFGTRFLAGLIRRNGNLRDALKSYGPMDAGYSYSDKVLSIFNRYNGN